jgi:hypothetical protein
MYKIRFESGDHVGPIQHPPLVSWIDFGGIRVGGMGVAVLVRTGEGVAVGSLVAVGWTDCRASIETGGVGLAQAAKIKMMRTMNDRIKMVVLPCRNPIRKIISLPGEREK